MNFSVAFEGRSQPGKQTRDRTRFENARSPVLRAGSADRVLPLERREVKAFVSLRVGSPQAEQKVPDSGKPSARAASLPMTPEGFH